MNQTILIADSGATKTDWCLLHSDGKVQNYQTPGINPYLQKPMEIQQMLEQELPATFRNQRVDSIEYYGAGVQTEGKRKEIQKILNQVFGCLNINAYSDLIAAARATAGREPGIVCILGTGSNSCYYDGQKSAYQHPSLGYIIGDEGGGVALGKEILRYYFNDCFSKEIKLRFEEEFKPDIKEVLQALYERPYANRYIASFTPFLSKNRGQKEIEEILRNGFRPFFERHVNRYPHVHDLKIHFCGSIAYVFKDVLIQLITEYGLQEGNFVKIPMEGLKAYHKKDFQN